MKRANKFKSLSNIIISSALILVVLVSGVVSYNLFKNSKFNKKAHFLAVIENFAKEYGTAIILNYDEYNLTPGGMVSLVPELNEIILNENCADREAIFVGEPNTVENPPVYWETSDASVATVSNGLVTAHATGTATITARTSNNESATCLVTVTQNYTRIHYLSNGDEFPLSLPASEDKGKGPSPSNTIVLESNGHFGLIDTGLANSNEDNPNRATAVINYLKKIKASKLDFIIITHAHYDHMGGLSYILNNIQTDNVYLKPYYSHDDADDNNPNNGDIKTRRRFLNILKMYFGDVVNCPDDNSCLQANDPSAYIAAINNSSINALYGTPRENVGSLDMTSTLHKINADSNGSVIYFGDASIRLFNTKNIPYYSECYGIDENSNSIVSYIDMYGRKILIAGDIEPLNDKACYKKITSITCSDAPCSLMDDIINNEIPLYDDVEDIDLLELSHHGYSSCDLTASLVSTLNPTRIVIPNWSKKITYYYGNNGYYSGSSCKSTYFSGFSNTTYVNTHNQVFDFTNGNYDVYTND